MSIHHNNIHHWHHNNDSPIYLSPYDRAGIGLLLPGIDESVVNMHIGDRYHLVFGGDLAFGEKGRPSGEMKMMLIIVCR